MSGNEYSHLMIGFGCQLKMASRRDTTGTSDEDSFTTSESRKSSPTSGVGRSDLVTTHLISKHNYPYNTTEDKPPRVLKKRSRSKSAKRDRRSKSLEPRKSNNNLHSSFPKSKDDLDYGVFTIIAKPPNPWAKERRLRKEKSCPDIQQQLRKKSSEEFQSFSVSPLNLKIPTATDSKQQTPKFTSTNSPVEVNSPVDHTSATERTTHTIFIQGKETCDETDSGFENTGDTKLDPKEEPTLSENQDQNLPNSQLFTNHDQGIDSNKTSLTELDIGHLKQFFKECVVTVKTIPNTSNSVEEGENKKILIETHDQAQANELKKSFEQLLDNIESVTKELQLKECVSGDISSDVTTSVGSKYHLSRPPESKPKRRIVIKVIEDVERLFEQSIIVLEDFVCQLFQTRMGEYNPADFFENGFPEQPIYEPTAKVPLETIVEQVKPDEYESVNEQMSGQVLHRTLRIDDNNNNNDTIEKTTFSSVSTTANRNNFKFIYTIDAELSHLEYNKLLRIIKTLREQKQSFEQDFQDLNRQFDKQNQEKENLIQNNELLRESLEAANKSIKEINEKVYELKQTMVPLRKENEQLKKDNEELLESIDFVKQEHSIVLKEANDFNKMKSLYEEKIASREEETEAYRNEMQEKFSKLEDLYRSYQKDMDIKLKAHYKEIESLRLNGEKLQRELDSSQKVNGKLEEEINKVKEINHNLDEESRKLKSLDLELLHTSKENKKFAENIQEIEQFYKTEIDELNREMEKLREESEKQKQDQKALEEENERLKVETEGFRIKHTETTNFRETAVKERNLEVEKNQLLQAEIESLQNEMKKLVSVRQNNLDITIEQQKYLSKIETLQDQVREVDRLKREQFVQQHDYQRMENEVERYKEELTELQDLKKQNMTEKFEKEKLKLELHHLKEQLLLVKDQQNTLQQNPSTSDELKKELSLLRNEMKDLAEQSQDRSIEVYTNELKGQLASLKDQIKELDVIQRTHDTSSLTSSFESHQRENYVSTNNILDSTSPLNDQQNQVVFRKRNLDEGNNDRNDRRLRPRSLIELGDFHISNDILGFGQNNGDFQERPRSVIEDRNNTQTFLVDDLKRSYSLGHLSEGRNALSRSRSAGEVNRIYVSKSSEISKFEQGVETEKNSDEESMKKIRQKQIEDRIRRKRDKRTDWTVQRHASLDRIRRQTSLEELTKMEHSEELTTETEDERAGQRTKQQNRSTKRRPERSPSVGRRSRSEDPNRNQSENSYDEIWHNKRRERGRSPQRRETNNRQSQGNRTNQQNHQEKQQEPQQNYPQLQKQQYPRPVAVNIVVEGENNKSVIHKQQWNEQIKPGDTLFSTGHPPNTQQSQQQMKNGVQQQHNILRFGRYSQHATTMYNYQQTQQQAIILQQLEQQAPLNSTGKFVYSSSEDNSNDQKWKHEPIRANGGTPQNINSPTTNNAITAISDIDTPAGNDDLISLTGSNFNQPNKESIGSNNSSTPISDIESPIRNSPYIIDQLLPGNYGSPQSYLESPFSPNIKTEDIHQNQIAKIHNQPANKIVQIYDDGNQSNSSPEQLKNKPNTTYVTSLMRTDSDESSTSHQSFNLQKRYTSEFNVSTLGPEAIRGYGYFNPSNPKFVEENSIVRSNTLDRNFRVNKRSEISAQKEELIRSIKEKQGLTLMLSPTQQQNKESRIQHYLSENHYSTVTPTKNKQNSLQLQQKHEQQYTSQQSTTSSGNWQEQQQMVRMEKARQKMLKKIQEQQKEQQEMEEKIKSLKQNSKTSKQTDSEVVTIAGKPLKRQHEQHTDSKQKKQNRNSFISEDEADAMYYQQEQQRQLQELQQLQQQKQQKEEQKQHANQHYQQSSHQQQLKLQQQEQLKLQQHYKEQHQQLQEQRKQIQRRDTYSGKPTQSAYRDNTTNHNKSNHLSRTNTWSFKQISSTPDERDSQKLLRNGQWNPLKLNQKLSEIRASRKQENQHDIHSEKKSDIIQKTSPNSSNNFNRKSSEKYSSDESLKSGDQMSGDVGSSTFPRTKHFFRSTGMTQGTTAAKVRLEKQRDGSNSLLATRVHNGHNNSKHDMYHCEKCRKLNSGRREGEPMKYCWERYNPNTKVTKTRSKTARIHTMNY